MRRLLPNPGPTSVEGQLDELELARKAGDHRPYVITNFAITLDGRATIQGRSGAIGSDADTEMLVGLRTKVDAVMIGAGTLRAERYGRIVPDPDKRARRERERASAMTPSPWWSAVVWTSLGTRPCSAKAPARCSSSPRHRPTPPKLRPRYTSSVTGVEVDLAAALGQLRAERGVRTLLCEGGPMLHAQLIEAGLVDELFVTHAPKLAGGQGPGLVTGLPEIERPLELAWLLEQDGELFARYRTIN